MELNAAENDLRYAKMERVKDNPMLWLGAEYHFGPGCRGSLAAATQRLSQLTRRFSCFPFSYFRFTIFSPKTGLGKSLDAISSPCSL